MIRSCGNCKYYAGNNGHCICRLITGEDICNDHEFTARAKKEQAEFNVRAGLVTPEERAQYDDDWG